MLRILWAVDPGAEPKLQRAAVSAIRGLACGSAAAVEPVYLLSTFLDSAQSQSFGDTIALTRESLRAQFSKAIGRAKLPGLKPLTLLGTLATSARLKAAELVDYAKTQRADVLVLATHGRSGIKRWFLGSFAESVMQQVPEVPLLIVNPHWQGATSFRNILFPTDFSEESKNAYLAVLDFAKTSGLSIVLFHRIALTITPELHVMLEEYPEYERIRDQEAAECRLRALSWAAQGKRLGVKVTVCIDSEGVSSAADAILRQQKKMGSVIALASQSGEAPPLQLGVTTRAVIQGSASAVWVLPPSAKAVPGKNRLKSAA